MKYQAILNEHDICSLIAQNYDINPENVHIVPNGREMVAYVDLFSLKEVWRKSNG